MYLQLPHMYEICSLLEGKKHTNLFSIQIANTKGKPAVAEKERSLTFKSRFEVLIIMLDILISELRLCLAT